MKRELKTKLTDPERINQKLINKILDAQNQSIEFIAFSGGGAVGISYSGVYSALIDSGITKGIKSIAGSSIGSLAASLISSGISKEDYYNLSLKTNIKNLLSEKPTLLYNDGKPFLKIVRKTIQENLIKYFDKLDIETTVDHQIFLTKNQLSNGYEDGRVSF